MNQGFVKTVNPPVFPDTPVNFFDEIQPGSCRPWVSIEGREHIAPPGRRVGFRVQVDVPEDAVPQECRFALLIQGDETLVKDKSGGSIPVAGCVGVIFYVAVNGAEPVLEATAAGVRTLNGERVPVLKVENTGNAHGRISGFLSGIDAKGQELDFSPSSFPVLPGETRIIHLSAATRRGEAAKVEYPVTINGHIEWGKQRVPFGHIFEK